jgi:hypothetical protein
MGGHERREVAIGELQIRAARIVDNGRLEPVDLLGLEPVDLLGLEPVDLLGLEPVDLLGLEPVDLLGLEPVDHTWQNKNRVFPVQGPSVTIAAVRHRVAPARS